MSASKNINAEKIQGNLNVNGLSATTVNVNDNYSLPNTAGTDGQVLTINGSGGVEWSSVTKTTLNVSIGTNDQIPFMNSTPNDFDYSSDLIFDGSKLRVTDGGDYVVVINAEKIKVTGEKFNDKKYYTHSLYPGGLKTKTFREMNEKHPERIIEEAVKGMLPKNKLGKSMIKKLKVFSGPDHEHESQQPIEWNPKI